MKSLSLFTLQGLGNSILAYPIVESLKNFHQIKLYLMNETAYQWYCDLNLGIQPICLNNAWEILSIKCEPTDMAITLYPNWKRELFMLLKYPAQRKISFLDHAYKLSYLIPSEKIKKEELHDIENNFKILAALGHPAIYPSLSRCFPAEKKKSASLHLTATTPYKDYPDLFWIEIINYFISKGYEINILCGHSDAKRLFASEVFKRFKDHPLMNYHVGKKLIEVAKTISMSQIFIGVDSSLMHLAAMLNLFTIGLWSFADYKRIYPYGNNSHVYIPEEVIQATRFAYPNRELPWIKRANPHHIFEIMESSKKENFVIIPQFVNQVKFYVF